MSTVMSEGMESEMMLELQSSIRQVLSDQKVAADENLIWSQAVELGWLMVAVPEEQGGLGLGLEGACVVQWELGRSAATVPVLSSMLAIDAVCQSSVAGKDELLEALMGGEVVAVSMADCKLSGSSSLNGTVSAVPSADTAAKLLAWTERGDCLALLDAGSSGVTSEKHATWDETRRLYNLTLDNVPLDGATVLAQGEDAEKAIQRLLTLRDFLLAVDSLGGADGLLEMTVEHLTVREQFGRPLAMFQALKHRCADLKAQTEASEALLKNSLSVVADMGGISTEGDVTEITGLKLKQFACTAFATVAEDSLQLHGGIGMASEHDCHIYLKRAMLNLFLGRQQDYATAIGQQFA